MKTILALFRQLFLKKHDDRFYYFGEEKKFKIELEESKHHLITGYKNVS